MASEDDSERPGGGALVASSHARVVIASSSLLIASPDGRIVELSGDTGQLARAIMGFLEEPGSRREVIDHVASLAEEAFDERVVHELLDVLVDAGAVERATSVVTPPAHDGRHIVLGVCGAIQATEAPRMVIELQRLGFDVRVALSDAARRFVSDAALRALTHHPVPENLWPTDPTEPVPHIEMAGWADLVLVYPASATTLSRIATGDCSDLVSSIAITTRAPVVLVPSMNGEMLAAPSVARNIDVLIADGFLVISPASGIEVARRPGDRPLERGPALAPHEVAPLLPVLLQRHGAPREAVDWDALYERGETPWETNDPDPSLLAVLAETPPPRSLLDVGAGTGAFAIQSAKQGYRVVAADTSDVALAHARKRNGGDIVFFVHDDIRATRLRSTFDIVVDRGCFHTLRDSDTEGYVRSMQSLCGARARLLLVHDAADALPTRRTRRLAPAELATLFPGFTLVRSERMALVPGEGATAWLTVLERT